MDIRWQGADNRAGDGPGSRCRTAENWNWVELAGSLSLSHRPDTTYQVSNQNELSKDLI